MDRVLIIIKKVCFSILICLCIIFILIVLTVLSAKVWAGADIAVSSSSGVAGEKEVTLYYGNEEFLITGKPEVPRMVEYKKVILPGERSLEEAIIMELYNSPADGMVSLIPPKAILLDVKIEFNRAVVNLSAENMHGGSLQEALVLEQIVHTLAENCDVEEVLILLDGKTAETLMGHLDISVPIRTRDHMVEYCQ